LGLRARSAIVAEGAVRAGARVAGAPTRCPASHLGPGHAVVARCEVGPAHEERHEVAAGEVNRGLALLQVCESQVSKSPGTPVAAGDVPRPHLSRVRIVRIDPGWIEGEARRRAFEAPAFQQARPAGEPPGGLAEEGRRGVASKAGADLEAHPFEEEVVAVVPDFGRDVWLEGTQPVEAEDVARFEREFRPGGVLCRVREPRRPAVPGLGKGPRRSRRRPTGDEQCQGQGDGSHRRQLYSSGAVTISSRGDRARGDGRASPPRAAGHSRGSSVPSCSPLPSVL
jgi:hypothetical protein